MATLPPRPLKPREIGAIVRSARLSAGLSQTELGKRMGASRFWVAEFEAGKPRAEIGLVLKAIHAVGLGLTIGPENHDPARRDKGIPAIAPALPPAIDLAASLEAASTPVRRE